MLRDRAHALREWEREATVRRDEMNGRDRAAIFEERNQSGAGIKDDPTNDPGGGRSHEYCPQVGACPNAPCVTTMSRRISGLKTSPSARDAQRQPASRFPKRDHNSENYSTSPALCLNCKVSGDTNSQQV